MSATNSAPRRSGNKAEDENDALKNDAEAYRIGFKTAVGNRTYLSNSGSGGLKRV